MHMVIIIRQCVGVVGSELLTEQIIHINNFMSTMEGFIPKLSSTDRNAITFQALQVTATTF